MMHLRRVTLCLNPYCSGCASGEKTRTMPDGRILKVLILIVVDVLPEELLFVPPA